MNNSSFWIRTLLIFGVVGLLLWLVSDAVLLFFAGIIISIILSVPTDWLAEKTRLPRKLAFVVSFFSILTLLVLVFYFFSPKITEQMRGLSETLPASFEQFRQQISDTPWAANLLESSNPSSLLEGRGGVISQATGAVSKTLTFITYILIILFVGVYIAYEPNFYKKGFLQLIPPHYRKRADTILSRLGTSLRWWLVGKGISMLAIGILTTVGLMLLDIPLALILGIIAGLFAFIPAIGPILSALPAILFGLAQSPTKAAYVILLYLGIQTIEDYLITPPIEKKTVYLPPALTIITQVLLGILFGFIGIVFAAPILVVILLLTKEIYIRDILARKNSDNVT